MASPILHRCTSMRRMKLFLIGFFIIDINQNLAKAQTGNGSFLDRFNYDVTVNRSDGFKDYGPEDWGDIQCDEENSLESCLAYRDKWETGREWGIEKNYCRWCPETDPDSCGKQQHQSPINLRRAVGYEPGTHELTNECIVSKIDSSFLSSDRKVGIEMNDSLSNFVDV